LPENTKQFLMPILWKFYLLAEVQIFLRTGTLLAGTPVGKNGHVSLLNFDHK
jgi:hypothetical protein